MIYIFWLSCWFFYRFGNFQRRSIPPSYKRPLFAVIKFVKKISRNNNCWRVYPKFVTETELVSCRIIIAIGGVASFVWPSAGRKAARIAWCNVWSLWFCAACGHYHPWVTGAWLNAKLSLSCIVPLVIRSSLCLINGCKTQCAICKHPKRPLVDWCPRSWFLLMIPQHSGEIDTRQNCKTSPTTHRSSTKIKCYKLPSIVVQSSSCGAL